MARNLKLEVLLQAVDRATTPFRKVSQQSSRTAKALKASRDELKELERAQKAMRGWQQLKRQSEQTAAALAAEQRRVAELSRQIRAGSNDVAALTRERDRAIRISRALTQRQQAEQLQLQQLRDRIRSVSGLTGSMAERQRQLAQRTAEANQRMQDQQRRLARLAEQQRKLDTARASYDRGRQRAGAMAGAGAIGLAGGSGALYGAARFLGPGMEFDTIMSRVQALTRLDKNSPELAALRAQARQLGAETMFSATDAAAGQAFLAMAGFTPEAIRAAMPGLLDMAKAGDMDLARTADISSNILSSFGLDPSTMGQVADVLTKTFTTSNVSLEMLGETMKYVGPVAKAAGMSLAESAAMAGLLGNVGIQGQKAGTTLRAMLLRLAAPAGAAAKEMAKLGVSAKDSQGNIRPIIDIVSDVARATEKLGSGDQLESLKKIFGEEPAAGMAELLAQAGSGGILKYLDIVNQHQGAAAATAKIMADNLAGDLDELSSAWDDVRIQLFEGESSALRQLTRDVTSLVNRFGAWIKANPQLASTLARAAAALAVLAAAGGALLLVLGSLLGPLVMLRYGLTVLGIKSLPTVLTALRAVLGLLLANPIGATIAALAGGAYLIWRHWDWIGPRFRALWEGIKTTGLRLWEELKTGFSGGLAGIVETLINFSPLGLFHRAFAGVLSYFGIELPGRFTEFGRLLLTGLVDGIRSMTGMAREAISRVADSVTGWFKEKLGIRSPSRVFAAAGRDTLAGYQLGLRQAEPGPLKQISAFGQRMRQAGAGLALGAAALPAAAGVQFDSRPPITASAAPGAGGGSVHYHITVQAAPGMDERALARLVAAEVQRLEREKAARRRSALYDTE